MLKNIRIDILKSEQIKLFTFYLTLCKFGAIIYMLNKNL